MSRINFVNIFIDTLAFVKIYLKIEKKIKFICVEKKEFCFLLVL